MKWFKNFWKYVTDHKIWSTVIGGVVVLAIDRAFGIISWKEVWQKITEVLDYDVKLWVVILLFLMFQIIRKIKDKLKYTDDFSLSGYQFDIMQLLSRANEQTLLHRAVIGSVKDDDKILVEDDLNDLHQKGYIRIYTQYNRTLHDFSKHCKLLPRGISVVAEVKRIEKGIQ